VCTYTRVDLASKALRGAGRVGVGVGVARGRGRKGASYPIPAHAD
jgi:hypothetical protein